MDAWISRHQHLLGLSTTEGVPWSYIQVEIDHHVEELDLIRNTPRLPSPSPLLHLLLYP
jgi:hypothetical protein